MRFQEYSAELDDRSLFGLITLAPENKDYSDAPMIFEMDTSLGFFMIERPVSYTHLRLRQALNSFLP